MLKVKETALVDADKKVNDMKEECAAVETLRNETQALSKELSTKEVSLYSLRPDSSPACFFQIHAGRHWRMNCMYSCFHHSGRKINVTAAYMQVSHLIRHMGGMRRERFHFSNFLLVHDATL